MPALLGLFAANWRPLALLAVLGAAALAAVVLIHERDSARKQAAALGSELALANAQNAACQSAVTQQNAAVEAMRASAQSVADAADTREANLAAAASAGMEKAGAQAVKIAQATVPPGCDAAIKWGNAQARELGQW
ncbi:MAG TPA: hypothetical protein VMV13_04690 [Candidatus Binataceae bacterium]|nr:hypothetical protein [Candidatus Binataceae bacterium]